MKNILLTGAAGSIGTSLRNNLSNKYHFRYFDIENTKNKKDAVVANITNFKAILSSMDGIDAVVHLAANPNDAQLWKDVYHNSIGGTYNVFEAARQAGIKKIIYASSIQVNGKRTRQQARITSTDQPAQPDNLYAVGKLAGETLARFFSEIYDMSIICLRIGFFQKDPPIPKTIHDDILKSWCSPGDLAQLVSNCIETDDLGFQVFYGVSNNSRSLWNIKNARKLVNYQPKNNAEDMIRPPKKQGKIKDTLQSHALLFRAAVLNEKESLENWIRWLDHNDLEKIDLDIISHRLFPFIYFNLANQGIGHPQMAKLKGIYRRAWLENQLALQKIIPFIKSLQTDEIPILLLDDGTSILRLYDGQGVRRLYTLDLQARPSDIPKILKIIEDQDIWPKISYGERYLKVEESLEIWSPFPQPITLTWRETSSIKSSKQALEKWQDAQPAQLGDCPVFTLDLESHFLRSCIRANDRKPEAAFFSFVDVAWMLNKHADSMNWDRVLDIINANHKAIPVSECLQDINNILDISIIHELLDNIQKLPVSWLDKLEYKWVIKVQPFPKFHHRIIRRIVLYLRSPKIPGLFGLFRYFQYAWGGARLLSLPRITLTHIQDLIYPSWKKKK